MKRGLGGDRWTLDGHRVNCGNTLELRLPGDQWLPVRFELTFNGLDSTALLYVALGHEWEHRFEARRLEGWREAWMVWDRKRDVRATLDEQDGEGFAIYPDLDAEEWCTLAGAEHVAARWTPSLAGRARRSPGSRRWTCGGRRCAVGSTVLPISCSTEELAAAIESVQAGCRQNRCTDPAALAERVTDQIERAEAMADAESLTLGDVRAQGWWWEGDGNSASGMDLADRTLVKLDATRITVERGRPWSGQANGSIRMELREPTRRSPTLMEAYSEEDRP